NNPAFSRSFGQDVDAAINDLLIRTFKSGGVTGVSPEVAAAIQNSQAKTFEAFISDLDFAASIAGMTSNVSAFDQAMTELDMRFAEMTERARALGISIASVTEAQERERQALELQFRAPFIQ